MEIIFLFILAIIWTAFNSKSEKRKNEMADKINENMRYKASTKDNIVNNDDSNNVNNNFNVLYFSNIYSNNNVDNNECNHHNDCSTSDSCNDYSGFNSFSGDNDCGCFGGGSDGFGEF